MPAGVFTVVAIVGVIVSTIASITSAIIVIPTPVTIVTTPITLTITAICAATVALIPVLATITSSPSPSGASTSRHHPASAHTAHSIRFRRRFFHINLHNQIITHQEFITNPLTSLSLMVCLGVFSNSLTTCSDSKVIKQKPFL